ncbi:hypothetical protein DVJ78_10705 [Humibacter sp. BT305]|uniref:Uncharacterized protein n=1 Tax=Cnuibacter physcomitrellae TaxID=1619308 RepID=A0A1X9LK63_9MICO|nr:DUF6804 family protein [Cnuibacter physcomitrellae]ARJ05563.1 hypothetical protein B5808_10245 [Cnuibacter physcomitrellae]AXH35809.1 hypothetical protein DVJ78_10705 [Humibacter sp. BT305]MCS5496749.1 hypothetical protein [Cnuibacter physcomitrellae]GGI35968.1 hypothetical protein GCM10010988_06600 [Cnuibacter physcomitrellae]
MSTRQTTPAFTRPALAPGLLGAVVLMAFVAVVDSDWFTLGRYLVSILALIMCVFALQARQWWWLLGLVPIAVVWNPVLPIDLDTLVFQALHIAAAAVFVASGILIKVPRPAERR